MLFPFTVAVIFTLPGTVLVNVITASPFASVVTVALPTKVPVPLAIANVTEVFVIGLLLASATCAFTLFVEVPSAVAPVVTTISLVLLFAGLPLTKVTVAGLPFVILFPPTVAVMPTLPATVLVSVIVALPLASVVTVVLPTNVAVPLAIANVTDALATTLPLASVICAFTLFVEVPFAVAPVVTTLNAVVLTVTSGGPATN